MTDRPTLQLAKATIENFRRLERAEIKFKDNYTVFVGANNSGKSSACLALTYFLNQKIKSFTVYDFPVFKLEEINKLFRASKPPKPEKLIGLLPKLTIELKQTRCSMASDGARSYELDKQLVILLAKNGLAPSIDEKQCTYKISVALVPKDLDAMFNDFKRVQQEVTGAIKAETKPIEEVINRLKKLKGDFTDANSYADLEGSLIALKEDQESVVNFTFDRFLASRAFNEYFKIEAKVISEAGEHYQDNINLKSILKVSYISAQRTLTDEGTKSGNYKTFNDDNDKYLKSSHVNYAEAYVNQVHNDRFWTDTFNNQLKPNLELLKDKVKSSVDSPLMKVTSRCDRIYVPKMYPQFAIANFSKYELPESHGGSGLQNMYNIFTQVYRAVRELNVQEEGISPLIHLVILEEPETNIHSSARYTLVEDLYRTACETESISGKGGENNKQLRYTQMVLTTHAVEVVEQVSFDQVRYFKRVPLNKASVSKLAPDKFLGTEVVDFSDALPEPEMNRQGTGSQKKKARGRPKKQLFPKGFYAKHLLRKNLELLFCDAAVIVEGYTELLLLPKMFAQLRRQLYEERQQGKQTAINPGLQTFLNSSIGWVLFNGNHFQTLEDFFAVLNIPLLCITDIDFKKSVKKGQSVSYSLKVRDLNNLNTNSQVLKSFLKKVKKAPNPISEVVQEIKARNHNFIQKTNTLITTQGCIHFDDEWNCVKVLSSKDEAEWQQCMDANGRMNLVTRKITLKKWKSGGNCQWPVSFESAMVLSNLAWFKKCTESQKPFPQVKQLLDNYETSSKTEVIEKPFFIELHNSFEKVKSEFASGLLYSPDFKHLRIPDYILSGVIALGDILSVNGGSK